MRDRQRETERQKDKEIKRKRDRDTKRQRDIEIQRQRERMKSYVTKSMWAEPAESNVLKRIRFFSMFGIINFTWGLLPQKKFLPKKILTHTSSFC